MVIELSIAWALFAASESSCEEVRLHAAFDVPVTYYTGFADLDEHHILAVVSTTGAAPGTLAIFEQGAGGWHQSDLLYLPDLPPDVFIESAAIDGDVVVAGASADWIGTPGAAVVFRNVHGSWQLEQIIESRDSWPFFFGSPVDLAGDILAVASPLGYGACRVWGGRIHIYRHKNGSWEHETELCPMESGSGFARDIAIDNDLIVVGGGGNHGLIFTYRYDGETWQPEAVLHASVEQPHSNLGANVAVDGDVIVGGAHGFEIDGEIVGAIVVFRFTDRGWVEEAMITSPDGPVGGLSFGSCVAVHGDLIAVGSHHYDTDVEDVGLVHVFRFDGESWGLERSIMRADVIAETGFGFLVGLHGSRLVSGALDGDGPGTISVFDLDNPLGPDCDEDGLCDADEIAAGVVSDCDADLVPDSCESDCDDDGTPDACDDDLSSCAPCLAADQNGDGIVGFVDLLVVLTGWGTCETAFCAGDVDNDGQAGFADLTHILLHWGPCASGAP